MGEGDQSRKYAQNQGDPPEDQSHHQTGVFFWLLRGGLHGLLVLRLPVLRLLIQGLLVLRLLILGLLVLRLLVLRLLILGLCGCGRRMERAGHLGPAVGAETIPAVKLFSAACTEHICTSVGFSVEIIKLFPGRCQGVGVRKDKKPPGIEIPGGALYVSQPRRLPQMNRVE